MITLIWFHQILHLELLLSKQLNIVFLSYIIFSGRAYRASLDNVVVFDVNSLPECPTLRDPFSAVDVNQIYGGVNLTLSWNIALYTAGYLLYVGTDGNGASTPTNIFNGVNYAIKDQLEFLTQRNTSYYVRIAPYNGLGTRNDCPVWKFFTKSAEEEASEIASLDALNSTVVGANTINIKIPTQSTLTSVNLPFSAEINEITSQYASAATASSEYPVRRIGAILGRPDVNYCRSSSNAWASVTGSGLDFVTLNYSVINFLFDVL